MNSDVPEQRERIRKLREKSLFGIVEQTLDSSARALRDWEDKEKESYVPQYQPDEILEYITTIPQFDLREEFEPGSSTPDELAARLLELRYRRDWLEALLYITKEELNLFEGALEVTREDAEKEAEAASETETESESAPESETESAPESKAESEPGAPES